MIGEDFSVRVRDIRKKLWDFVKTKKNSGAKVSLAFDKLRINGAVYRWDAQSNKVILIENPSDKSSSKKNKETDQRALWPRRPQQTEK